MASPLQLAPFDTKEQWLSELPPDIQAPRPLSEAEPSHSMEETNFGCLYLCSNLSVTTIGEGCDVDWLVN